MVDVPEVNSRIALRTINKSGGENGENLGPNLSIDRPPEQNNVAAPCEEEESNNEESDKKSILDPVEKAQEQQEVEESTETQDLVEKQANVTKVIVETPSLSNEHRCVSFSKTQNSKHRM